ncbi:MarR family winged helix-turn-helix transcriptional regulator [Sodalis sp. RH21]|uniref:MarR family winged helix-turn-helix transcriptional regulator n=1 Tax=unclassified Sodalis (in: enterobacteria) TaxID=2636512 RepID=UPI0039B55399
MKIIKAPAVDKEVISEMGDTCVLMRARLISRVITAIHDEELAALGIGSAQFALLVVIYQIEPVTRAEIGRYNHQDRSTLTRNMRLLLEQGWIEEIRNPGSARGRPVLLTQAGKDLLYSAEPGWRAAQARARTLLGKQGVSAVMATAKRIMEPQPG